MRQTIKIYNLGGIFMDKILSSDLDFGLTGFEVPQTQRPYSEHRLIICENNSKEFKHIILNP